MKIRSIVFSGLLLSLAFGCQKNNTAPSKLVSSVVPSDVNLQSGLLVYLPFEGNMADSSGNGNPTTAVAGAALTYDEHGYANSAFGGTGNGERVVVTNNGSIKFDTTFTVSIEIMVRTNSRQAFASYIQRATAQGASFGMGIGDATIPNVEMTIVDTTQTCSGYLNASNSVVDTLQPLLQAYRWYNIVTTFHKGLVQIFVNGQLMSTKATGRTKVAFCTGAQFIVGGWWDNDVVSVNGVMDNVRLYNRVLNTDEITYLAREFQQE